MFFTFKLAEKELQICFWGWAIRRVPYADILEVKEVDSSWRAMAHLSENWNNPWPWRYVLLHKRTPSFWFLRVRYVTINPRHREKFVAELKQKIASGGQ